MSKSGRMKPMIEFDKSKLEQYFLDLEDMSAEDIMKKVESYMDDEAIEIFVDHIESFYGVEDDDELGTLAQIMISGFIAAIESQSVSSKSGLQ